MQRHTLTIILLSLWICIPEVYSHIIFRSRQIMTTDGLPNNSVRYIFQDSKGFIWLCTLNGLVRYDGNSFLTFQAPLEKSAVPALYDNRVYNIFEDRQGFLWINTASELFSCYDAQLDRFVDFTGSGKHKENFSDIYLANNGDLWLWHQQGKSIRQIIHQKDRTFKSIEYQIGDGNQSENRVNFVSEDSSGRIWVGTQKGLISIYKGEVKIENNTLDFQTSLLQESFLYLLTRDGQIYRMNQGKLEKRASLPNGSRITSSNTTFQLKDKWIIMTDKNTYNYQFDTNEVKHNLQLDIKNGKVITDKQGDYWIYNHTGRVRYIRKSTGAVKTFSFIPESKMGYIDHERYRITQDTRGIIWISTYGNGLFAYRPEKDELEHFTADLGNSPITSDYLLYIASDRSGNVWAAADESGLTHIEIVSEGTQRIFPEPATNTDRSNTIRMLARMDTSDIWIGTRTGGLYQYDDQINLKKRFKFPSTSVYAMTKDAQGRQWTGTRGEGLRIGDNWYKHIPEDSTSLGNNNIFDFHLDRKGRMWIATFGGGLNLAVPIANGAYKFRRFLCETNGLSMVRTVTEDQRGMMWVATSDGLCIFHPDTLLKTGRYHIFNHQNGTFSSNEIRCIHFCKDGSVAVGTSGSGLAICTPSPDYSSLKYTHYGKKEGLVNDVIVSLQEDNKGMLWIATGYGITRFNPQNHTFKHFFFAPQSQGNIYTENSSGKTTNGKLLFGTNYGLTVIDPQHLSEESPSTHVTFTGLYVNGILMNPQVQDSPLQKSLAYTDCIVLKHFQNSIRLQFSNFEYANDTPSLYQYRLENYDKEWSIPDVANSASYKYLNPGTYILHVRSCNSSGIWDEEEAQLKIIITPPFWKTGWAILFYVLAVIVTIIIAWRIIRKINLLRTRIQVEKQLTEHKLVFFTNISHEFRTPLTLIQAAIDRIQRNKNIPRELVPPLQTMAKGTQRMSRLINQILEFRKMQNGKLSLLLEEVEIIAFLQEICLQFNESVEQKHMNFQFLSSVPSFRMFIDQEKMDKIVYNLLSNAFKYTPANGTITLNAMVDNTKKQLIIKVTDNGIGIPKEKQSELFKRFMQSNFSNDSTGIGLHLTHELVTVHKGKITYDERPEGGSIFTVTLPTDKTVYAATDFLAANNTLTDKTIKLFPNTLKSTEPVTPTPLNNRKILIIEDDHDIRQLLAEEIGCYFEVETAEDGTSGFEKATSCNADLIVCDVLMPGMNGFDITRKLKNDFATSHIPVILLTALGSAEKQLEGIESGADAYISKPFNIQYLLARIFRLIEQREKLREKYCKEPGMVHAAMCSTDRDLDFVKRLTTIIEKNLQRPDFSIEEFASIMKLSRTTFYSKVRGITGYSPVEYLRIVRMKKAAELLLSKEEEMSVSEVSYMVGFNDPLYFSKCFKMQFGISPSVYKKGGSPTENETKDTEE